MAEQAQTSQPVLAAPGWRPYSALAAGVLAVSTAAIFIRLAQNEDAPSLVLAAARLSVAALALTPLVLTRYRAELRRIKWSDMKWALASGLALGLHFAAWITSLEYTAVVNSVVVVTTSPLWVALLAPLLLNEKLGRRALLGLMLALAGGVLVSLSGDVGDPPKNHDPLLGEGLALVGALMAAIYFVIGRRLRARLGVMVYIWLVYSVAAVLLLIVVALAGLPVGGLAGEAYLWMLLMGLVPQLIGHSAFNYALGFLPAAYVSLVVLGEPIGSGILAMFFLGEWPVPLQLAGSALILVGIIAATTEQQVEKIEPAD
ncbi:MAG: DMT family transporter [Chloroflexi bacterium]|jgi:drug/metabolite transporter (DMT)-like permease|nr:DMT family transporter [Chloroflexota bacterium]